MAERRRRMSRRGLSKLVAWAFCGTVVCLSISLTYNYFVFRDLGDAALRQGLISATVLPIALSVPFFTLLTLKLRDLAIANHRLNQLASIDGLTGCLNRRAFTSRVEQELANVGPDGGAMLVVDADRFKVINDRYGHGVGDEVLKLIASTIRASLRSGDALGRLGGEEFGIHLPGASRQVATEIAERVRQTVASTEFTPGGKPHHLSISVGCVFYDKPTGFRELFALADQRLYRAKRAGRNRVVIDDAPPLEPKLEPIMSRV